MDNNGDNNNNGDNDMDDIFQPAIQAAAPNVLGRRNRGADQGRNVQAGRNVRRRQVPNVNVPIWQNRDNADLPGEQWRRLTAPLNSFQASNLGRIKGMIKVRKQETLVRSTDPRLRVRTNMRTEYDYRLVDDLVLLAWHNDGALREQSPFIIHQDRNPKNNRIENLRRATYDEFHAHDDQARMEQQLPIRRIIRSRRFRVQHNPLIIHTAHPDYVAPRYVYDTGELSHLYREGQMVVQKQSVAGIARVEMQVLGRAMAPPVAELVVDSFNDFDPASPFIIYDDGDVTNLTRANLRPATAEENAVHLTNLLRGDPDEVFLPIQNIGDVDMRHYLVSNRGRVYATRTRTFLSWYEGQGSYAAVILYNNTLSVYYAVHRLVWSAHVGPIAPGNVIDHLDMDRQNNDLGNLEEVTMAVNTQRAVHARLQWLDTLAAGDIADLEAEQQEQRPNERWRPAGIINGDTRFPLEQAGYEVSDQGRVRNTRTGRILRLGFGYFGYHTVGINGRNFRVHRLVASTFIENEDPARLIYVDHRDGNRTNNFANNLRWVTPQQNTSYAHAVRMRAYRVDHTQQQIFNSISEAGSFDFNDRRLAITTIKDYMRRGLPLHGWYFVRVTDAATQRAEEIEILQEDQALPAAGGQDNDRVQEMEAEVDPLQDVPLPEAAQEED